MILLTWRSTVSESFVREKHGPPGDALGGPCVCSPDTFRRDSLAGVSTITIAV